MPQRDHFSFAVATDMVVFTLRNARLELLLIKRGQPPFKGSWALPGGFVEHDEDLLSCARRELVEETGVGDAPLIQLGAYGAADRDPRGRVIAVGYFALIAADRLSLTATADAAKADWFDVHNLPALAFDHATIVSDARARLRQEASRSALGLHLLPATFTLSEAQRMFELIRGEALDKRNFRHWFEALGCIDATGDIRRGGAYRPAKLFRVRSLPPTVKSPS